MGNELTYLIRYRLQEWGRWYCCIMTAGLGYSGQSCLDNLCKNKGTMIASTAQSVVPDNPAAEAVDQLIVNLAKPKPDGVGKPQWVKVVRIHYTFLNQPETEKLKAAKLSRSTYYHYLRQCERYLAPRLLANTGADSTVSS
ncbi:MAG: hypothetical protein GY821_00220 [Gammaproteobacteria bacterium]|nr:hypothetical protein [Gammaproteobacteria bacterium]